MIVEEMLIYLLVYLILTSMKRIGLE